MAFPATSYQPPAPDQTAEFLAFLVRGESFCIPITSVREIRTWSDPTPLPLSQPALRGVINLRGVVLPILDLGLVLGLADAGQVPRPVVVVVDDGARLAGLMVDRVINILALPLGSLEPPPAVLAPGAARLQALALHDGQFLRILDPAALLPDRIGELQ